MEPTWLKESPWVHFGTTTLADGDAKDSRLLKDLLNKAHASNRTFVSGHQVHGDRIERVTSNISQKFNETDGLITDRSDVVLGIYTADCVPIFVMDDKNKVISLLHAGWRGTKGLITHRCLEKLQNDWGSSLTDLHVVIGPRIKECCYEVGEDVSKQFSVGSVVEKLGKIYLSLGNALRDQFTSLGLKENQIRSMDQCTHCSNQYFSYRKDKTKKRMLSYIFKETNS